MTDCSCNIFPASLGNIGIGTASPGARLEVAESTATNPVVVLRGASGQSADLFRWVRNDGFVFGGIKPTGAIELQAGIGSIPSYHGLALVGSYVSLCSAGGGGYGIAVDGNVGFRVGSGSFGAPQLALRASDGRLGVGTTASAARVEAWGTDAGVVVHYAGNSRGGLWALSGQRIAFATTVHFDHLVFGYGGVPVTSGNFVERMRINNETGNVGIGTTSPQARLHVEGDVRTNGPVNVGGTEAIDTSGVATRCYYAP